MFAQILEWVGLFTAGGLGGYGLGIRRKHLTSHSGN